MRQLPECTLSNDVGIFLDTKNLSLLPKYKVHVTLHVFQRHYPQEELKEKALIIGNRPITFWREVHICDQLIYQTRILSKHCKEDKTRSPCKICKRFRIRASIKQNYQYSTAAELCRF